MAANRDPISFDNPNEFIPERWLNGRKGRTDTFTEGGDKLGVTHLTYGCGRRVCPGIDSTFGRLFIYLLSSANDFHSGQSWSLLHTRTPPALLYLGATTSWGGGEETCLPTLPC